MLKNKIVIAISIIIIVLIIGILYFSKENSSMDEKLTYSTLNSLKINMSAKDVIDLLGKPFSDEASGVYSYIYLLDDEHFSEAHLTFDGQFLSRVAVIGDSKRKDLKLEEIDRKELAPVEIIDVKE